MAQPPQDPSPRREGAPGAPHHGERPQGAPQQDAEPAAQQDPPRSQPDWQPHTGEFDGPGWSIQSGQGQPQEQWQSQWQDQAQWQGPPPPQQWHQPQPLTPGEEQGWGVACHLGGALLSFLVPLIVWLVFRERSAMIDDHGRTALNLTITVVIAYFIAGVLTILTLGILFFLFFAVLVVHIVFAIIASVAAYNRQPYRYPVAIPFIR